jgi:hypothetical protein
MLAYPLMDQAVPPAAVRALLGLEAAPGGPTLHRALSALLAETLASMARRAHGARAAQDPAFRAGAEAFAREQSERLLWALEQETLVPLCDFDGTDAIYAELAALGRRRIAEAADHAG